MRRRRRQHRRLLTGCLVILCTPLIWWAGLHIPEWLRDRSANPCWRLAVPGSRSINLVEIAESEVWLGSPAGDVRDGEGLRKEQVSAFAIGQTELRVRDFVTYLNRAAVEGYPDTKQVVRLRGRYEARHGQGDMPIAFVGYADALGYCQWLGRVVDQPVRLPTEGEWESAARGGIVGAPFPNGWNVERHALHSATAKASEPNGFGLYDMSGNVFEWCIPPLDAPEGVARGGSYAERDASYRSVYRRVPFAIDYRDADLGFRFVIERTRVD